jgi:hypothetical protein
MDRGTAMWRMDIAARERVVLRYDVEYRPPAL